MSQDYKALADTLRALDEPLKGADTEAFAGALSSLLHYVFMDRETIISALERAAAAEGEKAEAWDEGWDAAQEEDVFVYGERISSGNDRSDNPYRSAS